MFKSPFSFKGRIRRLEYGLSYLIYFFIYGITAFIWQEFPKISLLFYLLYATLIWFILAQGAKRCHDLGNSGFYQFIPFYSLWMLFQDGNLGTNVYGENPKEVEQNGVIAVQMPEEATSNLELAIQLSSTVLLNILMAAILLEYLPASDVWSGLFALLTVIPFHFLSLLLQKNYLRKPNNHNRIYLRQRLLYATLFYICLRMYSVYFRGSEIQIQTIYFELIAIAIIFGFTYLPFLLYKTIFKNQIMRHET
ncbi:MAG: DUF805 domain-containing protein [Saonia sp.]